MMPLDSYRAQRRLVCMPLSPAADKSMITLMESIVIYLFIYLLYTKKNKKCISP